MGRSQQVYLLFKRIALALFHLLSKDSSLLTPLSDFHINSKRKYFVYTFLDL